MSVKNIVVTYRTHDVHVCVKGNPRIWGCGQTITEAIGDLMIAHTDHFEIRVEVPPVQKRHPVLARTRFRRVA